ncbi:hypothetical protein B0P06_005136 [Clostridium saccharoperbutylacetonicum]|nr:MULTISPECIES: hypothetical protein [Clostridium]NSB45365.1 hypothetical protein [Clostridium saccharoperbutylacetonicum]
MKHSRHSDIIDDHLGGGIAKVSWKKDVKKIILGIFVFLEE